MSWRWKYIRITTSPDSLTVECIWAGLPSSLHLSESYLPTACRWSCGPVFTPSLWVTWGNPVWSPDHSTHALLLHMSTHSHDDLRSSQRLQLYRTRTQQFDKHLNTNNSAYLKHTVCSSNVSYMFPWCWTNICECKVHFAPLTLL